MAKDIRDNDGQRKIREHKNMLEFVRAAAVGVALQAILIKTHNGRYSSRITLSMSE